MSISVGESESEAPLDAADAHHRVLLHDHLGRDRGGGKA